MTIELKPCPFCGTPDGKYHAKYCWVDLVLNKGVSGEELLDRAWNTRAESTLNDTFDDRCAKVGTYGCYVPMLTYPDKKLISVDACLVPEVARLNLYGAKTIGCCCGHPKDKERGADGFIQVDPDSVPLMLELGYEQLPVEQIDDTQMGQWCFKPKTDVLEMSKHKERME